MFGVSSQFNHHIHNSITIKILDCRQNTDSAMGGRSKAPLSHFHHQVLGKLPGWRSSARGSEAIPQLLVQPKGSSAQLHHTAQHNPAEASPPNELDSYKLKGGRKPPLSYRWPAATGGEGEAYHWVAQLKRGTQRGGSPDGLMMNARGGV